MSETDLCTSMVCVWGGVVWPRLGVWCETSVWWGGGGGVTAWPVVSVESITNSNVAVVC